MIKIFSQKSKIAVYDPENKYQKNLSIDNGIPKSNAVLGIRYTEKGKSVPVSLLQQKLENVSYKDTITDIICMFEKNIEEEKYSKLIYSMVDIKELFQENEDIKGLLTEELLKEIYFEEENISAKDEIQYFEEIQIGILGGKDYETVKSVYGEYAPFKKINSISEL